jgi:uncharacterized RDD family membrane protein YckC
VAIRDDKIAGSDRSREAADPMSDLEELAEIVRNRPPDRSAPRRARPGARFGAVLVDSISITVVSILLGLVLGFVCNLVPRLDRANVGATAAWCAMMLYFALEIFPGDSPGKWLVGITITLPDGRRAPRGRLLARWLIKYAYLLLMGAILMLGWVRPSSRAAGDLVEMIIEGLLMASWCSALLIVLGMIGTLLPQRRALHDWLSGTAVYDQIELIRKPPQGGHAFQVQQIQAPDTPEQS